MSRTARLTSGVLAGLLPVVWLPVSVDSFILPRTALTLTAAGILLWMGLMYGHGSLGHLRWPVVAVIAAALVATVFSIKPTLSLVGDYSRYESLPVRLAYVGLMCGAIWLASPGPFITGFLLGCGVTALEACYQAFTGALPRPDGNLGQPNLLGTLLAMALPLLVDRARRDWRWLPLALPMVVALGLSASRSGWLGAVLGLGISAVWWTPRRWQLYAAGATICVIAAGLGAILFSPLRQLNQDTGTARLGVWQDALHMIAARPVTGWGLDTTGLVFGKFQTADWQPGNRFDRAHTLPVDLMATQGVLGLAACTLLFATIWLRLWSRRPQAAGLAGALGAYLLCTLLNFDWAPVTAPLWFLAGCAWQQLVPDGSKARQERRKARMAAGALATVAGLALAVSAQAADVASYFGRADIAVRLDPLQPHYWSQLGGLDGLRRAAELSSSDTVTYIRLGDAEAAAGDRAAAIAAYRQALAIYPYDTTARQRLATNGQPPR